MKNKTNYKIETLLAELSKTDYLTAETIAEDLGVSSKTARSRMAELNLLISSHGAQIISRPRYGYHLQIDDPVKWDEYIRSRSLLKEAGTGTPEERTTYIALSLLTAADYIKISDFADELYVSPQVVSESLKECESVFAYYKLTLERKPYYGLRLIGREFDKRNCIVSRFINEFKSFLDPDEEVDKALSRRIFDTVIEVLSQHRVQLTEVSLQSTAAYVYLSYHRYSSGFHITDDDVVIDNAMKDRAYAAASDIFHRLIEDVSDCEIYYFGVYISAMRSNDAPEYRSNIVITKRIDDLVSEIFGTIKTVFGIDFSNNLRLRMMLAQHLLSLDLRIRYHIPLNNDMYLDVQKNYPYAYSIANEAVSVLAKEYQTVISASESDWLTLIFATGLYDIQTEQKLNVLVVCQEGRASSQLLKLQIQKNYSEFVGNVEMCTAYELESYDLSDIDYIFSTINIAVQTNVPIMMIDNLSLFQKDSAVENELFSYRMSAIDRFFSKDLFFTDIKGSSKEEILSDLCSKISSHRQIPEGFYESLMERETLHSTDYAPMIAIPHPAGLIPEEDIVALAILDRPVFWGRNEIQILLLTALSLKDKEATQLFFEVTSHFITNKKGINQLLRSPDFETFISLLSEIEIR